METEVWAPSLLINSELTQWIVFILVNTSSVGFKNTFILVEYYWILQFNLEIIVKGKVVINEIANTFALAEKQVIKYHYL